MQRVVLGQKYKQSMAKRQAWDFLKKCLSSPHFADGLWLALKVNVTGEIPFPALLHHYHVVDLNHMSKALYSRILRNSTG